MDTDGNKVTWVVIIVAAVAIMGGLFVKFVPNIDSQMQTYVQTVTGNLSGTNVDASSTSDFSYSAPDTAHDTISIVGYSGHNENLIIPQYRKIGSVSYKITAISNNTFKGNTGIKQVTIPDGLRTIGYNAFAQDSNLKSLTLGSDVTSIGAWAFQNTALTSVDFPASLKSIGGWAFQNTALTSVDFPASLKSIGGWAFANTPISAISFKKPVDLDYAVFKQTSLENVTLPTGSTYKSSSDPSFGSNVKVTIK